MPTPRAPGWAELAAGLVDAATGRARVKFAVKEQTSDGWVDLGGVELT